MSQLPGTCRSRAFDAVSDIAHNGESERLYAHLMFRRARRDAWRDLVGPTGLVSLALLEAATVAFVVWVTASASTGVQALAASASAVGVLGFAFLGWFLFRFTVPIRRWETKIDRSPSQLLFNLTSLEHVLVEREDAIRVHCRVRTPSGSHVQASEQIILDIGRHDTIFFDYPKDFGVTSIESGNYEVTWWWQEAARKPFRIANETYSIETTAPAVADAGDARSDAPNGTTAPQGRITRRRDNEFMTGYTESNRERERREWLEEGERLKDLEENFSTAKLAATLTEELRRELCETRRAYRIRGEQTGKRAGMVAITTIWWRRWLGIGIDHELQAREGFQQLAAGHSNTDSLLLEFQNAVITVCSAAFAIEAIHNDFMYRIPPEEWKRAPTQLQRIGYALRTGWALDEKYASTLVNRIGELLERRGDAVHAYPETLPARPHPAGLNSGAEHEIFNAVTAREAIDLALEVVKLTEADPSPDLPAPYDRWLRRWIGAREPYRDQVLEMQERRDNVPLDVPDAAD